MRVGSTFTRKKRIVRRPRKKPNPPQPEEPKIEITREDGFGQIPPPPPWQQIGGTTVGGGGPNPIGIGKISPGDKIGPHGGGGIWDGTKITYPGGNTGGGPRQPGGGTGQPQQGENASEEQIATLKRMGALGENASEEQIATLKRMGALHYLTGPSDPQPEEPEIEITREDGFGQQQGGGTYEQGQMNLQNMFSNAQRSGVTGPSPGFPAQMGLPPGGGTGQQQGGVRTGINPRTGQPGHPMRGASSIAPQQQGMGRPQQQGMGRPQQQGMGRRQGGMPGNVGVGTKRPIGVPPGAAGGTPRGY